MNGRNGWRMLTNDGAAVASGQDFRQLLAMREFPKSLLHPSIRDKVWLALRRNELDEAVRSSFIAVEDAVREAGKFSHADYGTDLMRKAFHPETGPLTNMKNVKITLIRTAEFDDKKNLTNGHVLFGEWTILGSHYAYRGGVCNVRKENAIYCVDEDFKPFHVYGEVSLGQIIRKDLLKQRCPILTIKLTENTKRL